MARKPEATSDQRKQIVSHLLLQVEHDTLPVKLKYGALKSTAIFFDISTRTISKIWKRARQSYDNPSIRAFRASPLKRSGRPKFYDRNAIREAILEVPINKRKTLRKLAAAIGVSHSTLARMKNDHDDCVIRPHSNAIKPTLEGHHKFARVLYAVAHMNLDMETYHHYYDFVHVDEKWFFLTEADLFAYLVPGEAPPERSTRHKSHILKVMFLAAISRPRYNADGDCTFDGKLGIWPFVESVVAQRGSIHRPAGTIERKPVSVTMEKYKEFLIEKVVPAIKRKWPDRDRNIFIQQDGASSHIDQQDPDFVAAAVTGNWNIKILTQPAQSPDTNHLDLSFFRAMQSTQWDNGFACEIDGLIRQVERAYEEFPARKIDFGFLTLQSCLEEILLSNGDNKYKIPHMGKEKLLRLGTLPVHINASADACLIAREVMGEFDGEFEDDVDGAGVE
jgi:hypothetical protein